MVDWTLLDGARGFEQPYTYAHYPAFHSGAVFAGRFWIVGTYANADYDEFPGIWFSENGRTWQLADVPDLRLVSDLVVGPGGLLAVGDPFEENTPLWLTANGTDWERITDPDLATGRISKVGATADGYVAVGTHMWWSPDGREWHPTASGPEIIPGEIVQFGERFLTIAPVSAASGGPLWVWTSIDLMEWFQEVELPHSTDARDVVLAEGPLGFIAAAYDDEVEPLRTLMWISTDGFSWTEVPHAPGPVSDAFVDADGFVAVGFLRTSTGCAMFEGEIQGYTWTSLDGHTWATMPLAGFEFARIDELLRTGRTLIGVGMRYDAEYLDTAIGAVWTARLPELPAAGPGPTTAPTPTPGPSGCG